MNQRNKLQRILDALSGSDSKLESAFASVNKEMKKVVDKIRQESEAKTVDEAKRGLNELKGEFEALFPAFDALKDELSQKDKSLVEVLETELLNFQSSISKSDSSNSEKLKSLSDNLDRVRDSLDEVSSRKIPDFGGQIQEIMVKLEKADSSLKQSTDNQFESQSTEFKKEIKKVREDLDKLRIDMLNAIASRQGGGNANRNISVNGNPSTLSRYTDLNLRAGANITLSYTNNDNLKTTDLMITSSGGAGTSRSISTVSVSSVVADTASTDIVIIANQGVLLTMPTAGGGNSNLYTIKNTSTSSVMVVGSGAETIDDNADIIMPIRYTSIDLISDGTNWKIT